MSHGHVSTADLYQRFAVAEAQGHSPLYQALSESVAADGDILGLLDRLPASKRQPNLLLGAVRFLGGPVDTGYPAFRAWVLRHWPGLSHTMSERRTQTNEAARCATLMPLLATLPQPLALIEVGASAGLCLYPDRYAYNYDGRTSLGPADGTVTLQCETNGPVPIPEQLPTVVWRAGVDLNPLSAADPDDARWLESLVWPEQTDRLARLRAALAIARSEPPHLVRGDLNETIRDLVAQAPVGATPVVFHSAVLAYLSSEARAAFAAAMRELPARWISNEAAAVLPSVSARLPRPTPRDRAVFVLALDEQPVALTGPHGQYLDWF